MTSTILIVAVILIISITATAYFHKREQQAKLIRQKVAQYKFRAGETQVLLDQLSMVGLPNFIKIPVVEYIISNYKKALDLDSEDANVKQNYNGAKLHLEELQKNQAEKPEKIKLPNKGEQLKMLISKLKRFVALFIKLRHEGFIGPDAYEQRIKYLKKMQLQLEAEGFIKIGRSAMQKRQLGTAKQYLLYAKQRLTNCGIADAYVQKQLERIQLMMDEIAPEITTEENSEQSQNKKGEEADTIFGPKKKW